MILRIALFLFLLIGAVFFPLPVVLFIFAASASFCSRFWEGALAGVLLDSLYFSPFVFSKFNIGFFTVSFILSVYALEKFKRLIQIENFIPRILLGVFTGGLFYLAVFLLFR